MSEMTMSAIGATSGCVAADQVAEWIRFGPAPVILDIRSRDAYDAGHLPESESAPLSRAAELIAKLPEDGLAVLVCEDGRLGLQAREILKTCGFFRAVVLEGGVREWADREYTLIVRREAASRVDTILSKPFALASLVDRVREFASAA